MDGSLATLLGTNSAKDCKRYIRCIRWSGSSYTRGKIYPHTDEGIINNQRQVTVTKRDLYDCGFIGNNFKPIRRNEILRELRDIPL